MYKILPRSHLHITHILSKSRPYHSHWNLGKNWKSWPHPPHLKVAYILNTVLFYFRRWPFPPSWLFLQFCGIFGFECFPYGRHTSKIHKKWSTTKGGRGGGGITEIKDYTIKNIYLYCWDIYAICNIYIADIWLK